MRHLNLYYNSPLLVMLVLVDINQDRMFWSMIDFEKVICERSKWWIEIPAENVLTKETKDVLLYRIGAPIDIIEPLLHETKMAKLFSAVNSNSICIHRENIKNKSLDYIWHIVSRLTKTRELAEQNRNKLEFFFTGYDDDERELFEIEEVCEWIRFSVDSGVPWFYLLNLDPPCPSAYMRHAIPLARSNASCCSRESWI